jgi:hypothetical protein
MRSRRHPNDETVPMDIDQPVFTEVRRAYTEADKNRLAGTRKMLQLREAWPHGTRVP